MTKLHSHLKKGLMGILSLTLILSNISVYAIDDTTNIIIEEDSLDDTLIHNHDSDSYEENNNIDLYSNSEEISTHSIGSFDITLTPNTSGYGSVSLDWGNYNYANKNFKVYKSSNGGKSYETVGIDYTSIKEVKCLQIYPCTEANGQLKKWMETNGYGKGIIKVDSVYWDDFNNAPTNYLYKNSSGQWNYDVILFGTWDNNAGAKGLNATSYELVKKYIEEGKGVIMGHDVVYPGDFGSGRYYSYLLAPYFGIEVTDKSTLVGTELKIMNKGLFTSYPWYIGDIGDILIVPPSHSYQSVTNATIWLSYVGQENLAPYLSTYNNCAMIQTGHSNGAATSDEQKILANLIFYMNQLLFNTYTTNDASAQDVAKPNNPSVSINNDNFNWSATDNGSTYYYYVESYDKNDTASSGLIDKSTTKSLTVTTGIKSYRYILDNNENTKVTSTTGTSTTNTSLKIDGTKKYLHIIAIDGAGNVSDTTTYEIPQTISLTTSIIWNDNNNKNGFRPSNYTLKLIRNGEVFKQVELSSSQTSYTFSDLNKYDSNGNAFKYTFQVDASDRYKITLDENGNTITENYQNSTFAVIIPKNIALNGNTGKCNYNVTVSGTFYYNDTLTVTPSTSFVLKDKSGISSLEANVTQSTTTFTKDNLGSTSGSISLNKTKFAGKYDGTFNFNIKFVMKN